MTDQSAAPSAAHVRYDPYPPVYGASLRQAMARYSGGFFRAGGRASRSEFWWANLVLLIPVGFALLLIAAAQPLTHAAPAVAMVLVVVAIVICVFMMGASLGMIALSIRRLHDANLSGWWLLLLVAVGLVPVLGYFLPTLILGLLPSNPAGVRFGHADV